MKCQFCDKEAYDEYEEKFWNPENMRFELRHYGICEICKIIIENVSIEMLSKQLNSRNDI